jgi:hypothetical protein
MAEKNKLPILHYLADRKSSKISENILKTEEERFELETRLGKKQDEYLNLDIDKLKKERASKPSKIGDFVRKIADAEFLVPSFIQDFLRKGEDEGKDVASRLDNITSSIIGSITDKFRTRDALAAKAQGLTVKELREQTKLNKQKSKDDLASDKQSANQAKFMQTAMMDNINTEILEQLDDTNKNILLGNENYYTRVIEILKQQDSSSPTIQKGILKQITDLAKHATTGNSLRVHDANVTDRLDEANKHYEDQMEFSKDNRREAKIQAQKDGESQKELLNATKAGGAGMVAAGAGADKGGGLLSSDNILKAAGTVQAFRGLKGIGGLLSKLKNVVGLGGAAKAGMITGVGKGGTALASKALLAGGGKALLMGAMTTALPVLLAGAIGIGLFKGVKGLMQRRKEFNAMSPEEQKIELARRKQQLVDMGFMGTKKDDEKIIKDQADKKSLGFVPVNSKLKSDALEKVSQESKDLKGKKEKGDGMINIANSNSQVVKNDSVNNYTPPVVDHSRILFRTGISG